MAQQKYSHVATCSECEGVLQLGGKIAIGRKVSCRRCGAVLTIIDRKPVELALANTSYADNSQAHVGKKQKRNRISYRSYQPMAGLYGDDLDDEFAGYSINQS